MINSMIGTYVVGTDQDNEKGRERSRHWLHRKPQLRAFEAAKGFDVSCRWWMIKLAWGTMMLSVGWQLNPNLAVQTREGLDKIEKQLVIWNDFEEMTLKTLAPGGAVLERRKMKTEKFTHPVNLWNIGPWLALIEPFTRDKRVLCENPCQGRDKLRMMLKIFYMGGGASGRGTPLHPRGLGSNPWGMDCFI